MAGRRVGGRFVTHTEAEIYQRALVAPAVTWKQEWVTPAGLSAESKYKVRKWVKSGVPQEFSDESDQEEVQELFANNSAPTMELPPKPLAPREDAPAAAAAEVEGEDVKAEDEEATVKTEAALEDAEMADDDVPKEAKPTDLSATAPMLPASEPTSTATTSVNLAPPPTATAAVNPSSPLSPAASSPLSVAPSPFPSSAPEALESQQEDPSSTAGQAHPLPGADGEMALKGEDGSDPRSEGARIGVGAPDQAMYQEEQEV